MTRDDIIRMARSDDWAADVSLKWDDFFVRFAVLVAAAKDAEHAEKLKYDIHSCGPTCQRYACVATRKAVAAEREACAKVCEDIYNDPKGNNGDDYYYTRPYLECAAAIRARGQS